MKITNRDEFKTVVYTIETEDATVYTVIETDNPFESLEVQYIVTDSEGVELYGNDPLYEKLINCVADSGPTTDGAGFTAEDANDEDDYRNRTESVIRLYLPEKMLSADEYKMHIIDKLNHMEDYDIDENSRYHEALKFAYDNIDDMYDRYCEHYKYQKYATQFSNQENK